MRDLNASITRLNSNFQPQKEPTKNWEFRWIKIPNAIDFSEEIWVRRWVKVSEPESSTNESVSSTKFVNTIEIKKVTTQKAEAKVYKCKSENCNKTFSDHTSLKKHMVIHGERQYICQVETCGKKFLDKSKLRRHQLVHTGERPYKCEICSKKFSLDFNLRTHIRTHTGSKPYLCSYPSKCFFYFTFI